MTISDVVETARKNECVVFISGVRYESSTLGDGTFASFWETSDRFNDNCEPDLSFPADAPVRLVGGCAVVTGEDGGDYTVELYQLAKFPIV